MHASPERAQSRRVQGRQPARGREPVRRSGSRHLLEVFHRRASNQHEIHANEVLGQLGHCQTGYAFQFRPRPPDSLRARVCAARLDQLRVACSYEDLSHGGVFIRQPFDERHRLGAEMESGRGREAEPSEADPVEDGGSSNDGQPRQQQHCCRVELSAAVGAAPDKARPQ